MRNTREAPSPSIKIRYGEVRYGPQTTDEMAVSFTRFIVGVNDNPLKLFRADGLFRLSSSGPDKKPKNIFALPCSAR